MLRRTIARLGFLGERQRHRGQGCSSEEAASLGTFIAPRTPGDSCRPRRRAPRVVRRIWGIGRCSACRRQTWLGGRRHGSSGTRSGGRAAGVHCRRCLPVAPAGLHPPRPAGPMAAGAVCRGCRPCRAGPWASSIGRSRPGSSRGADGALAHRARSPRWPPTATSSSHIQQPHPSQPPRRDPTPTATPQAARRDPPRRPRPSRRDQRRSSPRRAIMWLSKMVPARGVWKFDPSA